MLYRYHYSFVQKSVFVALWLLSGLFVAVNYFSNPILAIDGSAQTLSATVVFSQVLLLVVVWCQFAKSSCSMKGMLRWLAAGVIALPYVAQLGLLSYITF